MRVGNSVYVAGTALAMPDGGDPPIDPWPGATLLRDHRRRTVRGGSDFLADVVRTRMYITPDADFDEVGRAHGEIFRDIRPVNTTVIIAGLVDPRWHLEIDVDAVVD